MHIRMQFAPNSMVASSSHLFPHCVSTLIKNQFETVSTNNLNLNYDAKHVIQTRPVGGPR